MADLQDAVNSLKLLGGRTSTTEVVAISTTTAVTAVAIAQKTTVRIVADVACFIAFGATATVNDIYLPANTPESFNVGYATQVAAITATGTGNLYVTKMDQAPL